MSCDACSQDPLRGVFYRWKHANVEIVGCRDHVREILAALNAVQGRTRSDPPPSELYRDESMMRMRAQMDESAIFLALATPHWLDDPICWAQLGYALMKGKPILLLLERGTLIPDALRGCASAIEEYASPEDAELACKRLLERQGEHLGGAG